MQKSLFFLSFLTIKVTSSYTVLKVISARHVYITLRQGQRVKGNLRKASKLFYQALHPGNNKQNVPLALAFFHDSTAAAKVIIQIEMFLDF